MNESSRKNMQNVIILVILLAGLGFGVLYMMKSINSMNRRGERRAKADTAETATNMPPVPTTSGGAAPRPGEGAEIASADTNINPNQFKVYELNPPKNPFMQKEQWYSEELAQVPGYPELENNDYFERNIAYLPDLDFIDDYDWESIIIERRPKEEKFEISGTSEDGSLATVIQLTPKPEAQSRVEWKPETGIPVTALTSPNWLDRYGDQLTIPASTDGSSEAEFYPDGLGVPGEAGEPDAEDMREGAVNGDQLYCVGVSIKGGRARALMQYNGSAYLVEEGSVLPTHYQVLEVQEGGVVLIDLHDGSSKWVPIGAAPAPEAKVSKERST